MAGMILCFVVPGILAGLLLGDGARQKAQKQSRAKRTVQPQMYDISASAKKALYVSDLRSEWKPKEAMGEREETSAA